MTLSRWPSAAVRSEGQLPQGSANPKRALQVLQQALVQCLASPRSPWRRPSRPAGASASFPRSLPQGPPASGSFGAPLPSAWTRAPTATAPGWGCRTEAICQKRYSGCGAEEGWTDSKASSRIWQVTIYTQDLLAVIQPIIYTCHTYMYFFSIK